MCVCACLDVVTGVLLSVAAYRVSASIRVILMRFEDGLLRLELVSKCQQSEFFRCVS